MSSLLCQEGRNVRVPVAQVVYKLFDCDPDYLGSPAIVWRLLREATRESWQTRLGDSVSSLPRGGISGFVRLGDVHISIRTWPGQRYAELSVSSRNGQFTLGRIDLLFARRLSAAWIETVGERGPVLSEPDAMALPA